MSVQSRLVVGLAAVATVLAACQGNADKEVAQAPMELAEQEPMADGFGRRAGGAMPSSAPPPAPKRAERKKRPGKVGNMAMKSALDDAPGDSMASLEGGEAERDAAEPAARTRAWFPETFLFEPRVVTDAEGRATVDVRVPDRLTTWRILGLAHDRSGQQAGAVTSFLGTLPVYVEVVVPPFARRGDRVRLPVQVVNTTEAARRETLSVAVAGARLLSGASETLSLPAQSSTLRFIDISASDLGTVEIRASVGSADAVVREIEVGSTDQRVRIERGGTLAAPRTQTLKAPEDALSDGASYRLEVFPGALALLRSELASTLLRRGPAEDAYSLLLSRQGGALLRRLGESPDEDALRKLAIVSGQRALQHARSSDLASNAILLEAGRNHPTHTVAARMADRLRRQLVLQQRADGSFGGRSGWTLQRLLVLTAAVVRALTPEELAVDAKIPADVRGALLRAGAVFERNAQRIDDPYTAAAVLTSGAVDSTTRETLLEVVRKGFEKTKDGAQRVVPARDVVRADGRPASVVDGTAMAILALSASGDDEALLADAGATLLETYRPGRGWGDGRSNVVALRAALALFSEPLPDRVHVRLEEGGVTLAETTIEKARVRGPSVLEAEVRDVPGAHELTVVADPALPGLGYRLELSTWVPWPTPDARAGLELAETVEGALRRGVPTTLRLRATAPAGRVYSIEHGLPVGVRVDAASLETAQSEGRLSSFELEDGRVTIEVGPLAPGALVDIPLRVTPQFSGKLSTGVSIIRAVGGRLGTEWVLPPRTWSVD